MEWANGAEIKPSYSLSGFSNEWQVVTRFRVWSKPHQHSLITRYFACAWLSHRPAPGMPESVNGKLYSPFSSTDDSSLTLTVISQQLNPRLSGGETRGNSLAACSTEEYLCPQVLPQQLVNPVFGICYFRGLRAACLMAGRWFDIRCYCKRC